MGWKSFWISILISLDTMDSFMKNIYCNLVQIKHMLYCENCLNKKSWNAHPEMILPHCTLKRRQQSHDRAYFCICAAETKHLSVVVVQCIPKGTNLPNYSLEGASNGFNSFSKEHSCSNPHNLRNFFTFFNSVAWLLYCFHFPLATFLQTIQHLRNLICMSFIFIFLNTVRL